MARQNFARKSSICPPSWRVNLSKVKWNKVIYDRINEIEKGEESTKPQKPLRLGTKKSFRRRVRSFRIRVSKLRIRIKISPMLWLKKLCDAYVNMMLGVNDQLGGGGGLVMGFHSVYPMQEPRRRKY
ncbi:unnamed protein product [Calypogeia fissa]